MTVYNQSLLQTSLRQFFYFEKEEEHFVHMII